MSRSKTMLDYDLKFEIVRDVFLNKEGQKIGQIVNWNGKRCFYTKRRHTSEGAKGEGHYLIKFRGFAIDRALLNGFISRDSIDTVIIRYMGPMGKRYFISSIDEWIMNGHNIAYSKEVGEFVEETFGTQKALCEDRMYELIL
jgi:hypothetical protein